MGSKTPSKPIKLVSSLCVPQHLRVSLTVGIVGRSAEVVQGLTDPLLDHREAYINVKKQFELMTC